MNSPHDSAGRCPGKSLNDPGYYYQCAATPSFKYWKVYLEAPPPPPPPSNHSHLPATLDADLLSTGDEESSRRSLMGGGGHGGGHHHYTPEKSVGVCLPDGCDANDVAIVTNDFVLIYMLKPKLKAMYASDPVPPSERCLAFRAIAARPMRRAQCV